MWRCKISTVLDEEAEEAIDAYVEEVDRPKVNKFTVTINGKEVAELPIFSTDTDEKVKQLEQVIRDLTTRVIYLETVKFSPVYVYPTAPWSNPPVYPTNPWIVNTGGSGRYV